MDLSKIFKDIKVNLSELPKSNDAIKRLFEQYLLINCIVPTTNSKDEIIDLIDQVHTFDNYFTDIQKEIIRYQSVQVYNNNPPVRNATMELDWQKNKQYYAEEDLKLRQAQYVHFLLSELRDMIRADLVYLENKFREIENSENNIIVLKQGMEQIALAVQGNYLSLESNELSRANNQISKGNLFTDILTNSIMLGYTIILILGGILTKLLLS
ncbi:MAG: hypothetical protein INQ03_09295 [Candidatus Heimdallarchaeota archaeon]|nr:hypothetical protein [Candidatus Heimdallarchaeota archaeon]